MNNSKGFRIILTAMFASMVCVSTICIQIASPLGGYINLGDVFVQMSGFLLGPAYGAAAAGIGSGLADVLTGYIHYAPGTLIIKGLMALIAALLIAALVRRTERLPQTVRFAIAGIPCEIVMVLGYLFYAWVPLGHGAAAVASVPGNLVQGVAGIIIASILTPLVLRTHEIRDMLAKFRKENK